MFHYEQCTVRFHSASFRWCLSLIHILFILVTLSHHYASTNEIMPFALQSYMICPENIRKPNITKFIVIAHDTILYHLFFLFFLWNLDFFWYISVNASNTPWYRPYTRYCIASPCQIPITNILIMKPTDAVVSRVLNLFF